SRTARPGRRWGTRQISRARNSLAGDHPASAARAKKKMALWAIDGQSSELPDRVRQRGCRRDAQKCASGISSLALTVKPDAIDAQLASRCNIVKPTIGHVDPVIGLDSRHFLEAMEVSRSWLVRAHLLGGDHQIEGLTKGALRLSKQVLVAIG